MFLEKENEPKTLTLKIIALFSDILFSTVIFACVGQKKGCGNFLKSEIFHQAPVDHTCNPSCSGGRQQEDRGLKPAQENILKKTQHTHTYTHRQRPGRVAQVVQCLLSKCMA
jgi:hypothetical protein